MLRKVTLWEEISSFAHSEKRWVAKLECGHEVSVEKPDADRPTEMECPQCADNPEWKQALAINVMSGEEVVFRGRYPVEIETDNDGPFAVFVPETITLPPGTEVTEIIIDSQSSDRDWRGHLKTAFLDRPEEPDA